MSKDLTNVLKYNNQDVIFRFLKLYNVSESEAIEIFLETKKWLFACALNSNMYEKNEADFRLMVNDDLLIIDAMWHNFILFTKDYFEFCDVYFGRFIHHAPVRKSVHLGIINEIEKDFDGYRNKLKKSYKKQYSFIYDLFGQDTLIKWHKEWPVKYSKEKIKLLRN